MSGTELLIQAMEEFGTSEPTAVLVVFTSQNGDLNLRSNGNQLVSIGLAEYAKHVCLQQLGTGSQRK